nr:nucleotide-binding alpha-beta plait domain-containing protein [Tanacetum cinerariifolium]
MGIFRTKEDEVSKISTSIFVSNFPNSFSSKDLFHACKQYGHVVDSFIPLKQAKDENLKSSRIVDKMAKRFNKSIHNNFYKTVGNKDIGNSFVNVVKGSGMSLDTESTPMIVLDDERLNTKDLSYSLMGRVKEFTSLSNLKKVKDLFKENGGANSWFLVLNQASEDFTLGGRIAWVEVEGIPFKLWSGHTFNRIASKWGKLMEIDDYDDKNFHSKRLCILTMSKIMGVNVEDGKIQNAAFKLGCHVLKTPFTYLGTKVGENMSRKEAWKEVVDKVLSRLSKWKTKTLSIGGRFTLLKSVLGSIPIFHMSIFKVPSYVLKTFESIRSRFFNGQDHKICKASWVKWDNVLTSRDKGGLGVASLYVLNRELFPRLYALELHKHATVRMKLMPPSLDNSFHRRVKSGATESQFNSLLEVVQVINLVPCEDRYFWSLESDGAYSVASIRKLIDEKRFQE